ncbi:MAG: MFS transporter [Pseudomonas sp.]|jgi:PPP family 3-phenylpropionic acid transporter|nr:MFS transporter [Pseudomonas sp.]MDY0413727.1 MFS transporter [Pseudomonas sp.]NLO53384.1 MFS transporter [Gammaproteobacteria bacterium]
MRTDLPYWRLSGFYFFYFALLGATAPFLALYFDHLGFSAARIGELIAIPMLMRCLAPNLWAWLADRTQQRLAIVRFGALCTLLSFGLIFISQSFAWLALIMVLHAFFWHAILAQFEVITLAHLGTQTERYSQLRLWGSVGFMLVVIGFGYLFDQVGLDYYPWAILAVMSGIVFSSFWVPAQPSATEAKSAAIEQGTASRKSVQLLPIVIFLASVTLMQLSHGPYYTFLTLHLIDLDYSRALIGWLWALGVLAEIGLFVIMPWLLRRVRLKQIILVSLVLAVLRWWLLGFYADTLWVLLCVQVLHAATFGSFHVAGIHFVQRYFAADKQGQGQGLYVSFSGVGGALGALYAGYTWQTLGASMTFTIASGVALIAVLLVLFGLSSIENTPSILKKGSTDDIHS